MLTPEQYSELKRAADTYRETFHVYTHWKSQEQKSNGVHDSKKSMIKFEEKFKKIKKQQQIAKKDKNTKQEELPAQKKKQRKQKKIKKSKK